MNKYARTAGYDTRRLTDYEKEAWANYEAALDSVPNARMYDRLSIHKQFPHIQKAFDGVGACITFYRLKEVQ